MSKKGENTDENAKNVDNFMNIAPCAVTVQCVPVEKRRSVVDNRGTHRAGTGAQKARRAQKEGAPAKETFAGARNHRKRRGRAMRALAEGCKELSGRAA